MTEVWPRCGHERTPENTASADHCRICHRAHAARYTKKMRAKRRVDRAVNALLLTALELGSLRFCGKKHVMGRNDTICRVCAALAPIDTTRRGSAAYLPASAGFSYFAPKKAEDWAEYWDRHLTNQARTCGAITVARRYGREVETVVSRLREGAYVEH